MCTTHGTSMEIRVSIITCGHPNVGRQLHADEYHTTIPLSDVDGNEDNGYQFVNRMETTGMRYTGWQRNAGYI